MRDIITEKDQILGCGGKKIFVVKQSNNLESWALVCIPSRTDLPSPGPQFPCLQYKGLRLDDFCSTLPALTRRDHSANTPDCLPGVKAYMLEEDVVPTLRHFREGRPRCTPQPQKLRHVEAASFPHPTGQQFSQKQDSYFKSSWGHRLLPYWLWHTYGIQSDKCKLQNLLQILSWALSCHGTCFWLPSLPQGVF